MQSRERGEVGSPEFGGRVVDAQTSVESACKRFARRFARCGFPGGGDGVFEIDDRRVGAARGGFAETLGTIARYEEQHGQIHLTPRSCCAISATLVAPSPAWMLS